MPPACIVCSDTNTRAKYKGICKPCYYFYHDKVNRGLRIPQSCSFGTNNCHLTPETRKLCPYCRLQKLYSLGYPTLNPDHEGRKIITPKSTKTKTKKNGGEPSASSEGHNQSSYQKPSKNKQTGLLNSEPSEANKQNGSTNKRPKNSKKSTKPDSRCDIMKPVDRSSTSGYQTYSDGHSVVHFMASAGSTSWATNPFCQVCGDNKNCYLERNIYVCDPCRSFIHFLKKGLANWPTNCVTGSNMCPITPELRASCNYCRLQKMSSLGIIHPIPGILPNMNQAHREIQPTPESSQRYVSPNKSLGLVCQTCGDTSYCSVLKGTPTCRPCLLFLIDRDTGFRPWPTTCILGKNTCEIYYEDLGLCPYCRMLKMMRLGLTEGPK